MLVKRLNGLHPYIYAGLHDNALMDYTFKTRLLPEHRILEAVCEFFDVSIQDVISPSRRREFVNPRYLAMFLIRTHSTMSLKEIGEMFGGRDHSSIIHACHTVKDLCDTDKKYKNQLNLCRNQVVLKLSEI